MAGQQLHQNLNNYKVMQSQRSNTKQINKLEKQITDFQRQLTIEAKEQDIVKNYQMKQGDYQILITVYEASDLMSRGTDFWIFKSNKTACDAFVQIEINGQIQRTSVKKDTNNPIFDEKFYFKFKGMTLEELDRSSISFKIFDKKKFILNDSLIGSFELDWTNVYFKRNHQIYRGWLTLMDPFDEEEGIMGYLMVSVAVLGENDKVTVHDSAFIKDPMTTIQDTITMPKLQLIDYGINIEIYRAENLIPLDEYAGNVDAYVIAKFSGNKIDTSVKTSCNPQWDQLLRIGTAVPTKSKYVYLEVRNRNYIFGDDIIGIIKIPFVDLTEESEPRWGHLYGPPVNGKDYQPYNFATKMQVYGQEVGSHYRGRLLYKITGKKDIINKNNRSKISFKFPFKPTPVVPLKSYTLRLEVLDGFNLPRIKDRNECYIHCCIGQYTVISKSSGQLQNRSHSFYQKLADKKVQFPEDFTQIPDLIIYIAKGQKQKDRISYIRIPANQITNSTNTNPMAIYTLKTDLSLNNIGKDQTPGCLTARAHLFTALPPETKDSLIYEFGKKTQFLVKIFLYRAKNLPPMNESGDCDPKLVFHICGQQKQKTSEGTYNPIWNEVIDLEIETEDFMNADIEKALICNVYDTEENSPDNLIGNFMVKLSKKNRRRYQGASKKFDFIYFKPQWHPIINDKIDIGDPCFGHVLMGCAVFRKADLLQFKHSEIKIIRQVNEKNFQIYLLGARALEKAYTHLQNKSIFFQLKIDGNGSKTSKQVDIKLNSANINEMIPFNIEVSKNKSIIPYLEVKMFEKKNGISKFIGFTSISLYDLIPKIINQQQNIQKVDQEGEQPSEDTLIDLEELDEQLNIIRERRRMRIEMQNTLEEKKKRAELFQVQKMPVPKQLNTTTDLSSKKNAELDELLSKFVSLQNMNDFEYNYVSKLEEERDRQSLLKKDLQKQNMGEQKNDEGNLQNDEESSILHNEETSKQIKPGKVINEFLFNSQFHKQDKMKNENEETGQVREKKIREQSRRNTLKQFKSLNNEEQLKKEVNQLKKRFGNSEEEDDKTVSNFDMNINEQIQEIKHDERAIKYKDLQRIIKQEQRFTKQAMQRQENYKYAAAVKLSLFQWKQTKKNTERETYQDYDTDPEEDLDIIPQWYKGRKILAADFEELAPNKKIRSLPLYQGGNRIANLDIRQKKIIGNLKCIGLVVEDQMKDLKEKHYLKLLKPRSYVCRVYILKGKSLISAFSKKPSTFLRISCKGQVYDLKNKTLCLEQYNPEYYVCQQIPMQIPGPSTVKIQVMEHFNTLGMTKNKVLGYTEIDIEQRHFTKKWHLFTQKKPIQLRNLYSQYGNGTQGRLEVWIDIIEKKNWLSNPPFKIHPPPFDKFQLRIIVWSTKQCVFKNEAFQSNDVYVRGFLGTSEAQETDTHWACRGQGNFNYRFKFEVCYPPKPQDMYSDQFIVQIWDRDVVGYNNLIGEKRINLNKIHRIIQKAVKRKKAVKAKMKIRQKGLELTQKFWFDVYNHKIKDQFGQLQSQGKVQLSFELVPIAAAQKGLRNGFGRSEPNVFPTLPEPAGRLNFNLLHPLDFFKQLCGPELYKSICHKLICIFVFVLLGLLIYFVFGSLITSALVKK